MARAAQAPGCTLAERGLGGLGFIQQRLPSALALSFQPALQLTALQVAQASAPAHPMSLGQSWKGDGLAG